MTLEEVFGKLKGFNQQEQKLQKKKFIFISWEKALQTFKNFHLETCFGFQEPRNKNQVG